MAETVRDADANADPNTNGPARRASSAGFQLGRHSSSNARINEILENARERAESMAGPSPNNLSPRPAGSPILPPNSSLKPGPVNEDNIADEATGFISHTPPLNYNSLNATSTASSAPHVSKPSLRQRPSFQQNSGAAQNSETSRQAQSENRGTSWWQIQAEKFQSIELENKGSVARDHLAIGKLQSFTRRTSSDRSNPALPERTFLAWLRTSLSFASIGIAVTQLFRLNTSLESGHDGDSRSNAQTLRHMGKPLGTTFLGISILILFLGYKRYFQSQHWVMQGKFPASRGTIMIVAFVALAIMVASLVVVIAIHPSEHEL
ncbi:dna polymerase alpha-associated dna helicase a [Fusarium beomiforme]|uniref:Dna polymerase alpha-associated dna helicase a n=1 Tax=Fusarium beomiforme TaxID=44412 RepID=A0A9P5DUW7_9HYPO|nr:dna polymerase alpha-associated dna helicase a [Fusarium beomiforme]